MASEILAQDEESVTISGPDGNPVRIAKNGVSPEFINERLKQFDESQGLTSGGPSGLQPQSSSFATPTLGPPVKAPPVPFQNQQMNIEGPSPMAPSSETPMSEATEAPLAAAPKTVDLMDQGLQHQKSGIMKEAKAAEAQGIRDASYYSALESQSAELQKQKEANEVARQKQMADFQAQQEKADKDISDFKVKDFWADRSTGARIAAAIAVGLGAYAAGITGGENGAMKILDQAMSRDFERQKMEYSKLKDRKEGLNSVFAQKMAQFGDERQAELATQTAMLERAKLQVQKSASMAQTEGAQAKALQMVGAIEELQGAKRAELAAKRADAQLKAQENMVPTFGAQASSKEGAAKVNELAASTRSATNNIQQLLDIAGESGKSTDLEKRAKADTIARLAQAALRVPILGPGTVNEGERKIMEQLVSNPTAIFSLDANTKTRLSTLINNLNDQLKTTAEAYGVQTGRPAQKGVKNAVVTNVDDVIVEKDGQKVRLPKENLEKALDRGWTQVKYGG